MLFVVHFDRKINRLETEEEKGLLRPVFPETTVLLYAAKVYQLTPLMKIVRIILGTVFVPPLLVIGTT